jgi:tyrosyl-tRNA synthetase
VHGEGEFESALSATEILFGQGTADQLAAMPEQVFLQVFEGVPVFEVGLNQINSGINLVDLLAVETSIYPSKGEARKAIQQGALSLNKMKRMDPTMLVEHKELLNQRYMLVQKGKKNYFLIRAL